MVVDWVKKVICKIPMSEPNKKDFCPDDCKFLKPWEINQTELKENHECIRFRRTVFHRGFHPTILKCEECSQVEAEKDEAVRKAEQRVYEECREIADGEKIGPLNDICERIIYKIRRAAERARGASWKN